MYFRPFPRLGQRDILERTPVWGAPSDIPVPATEFSSWFFLVSVSISPDSLSFESLSVSAFLRRFLLLRTDVMAWFIIFAKSSDITVSVESGSLVLFAWRRAVHKYSSDYPPLGPAKPTPRGVLVKNKPSLFLKKWRRAVVI